MRRVSSDESGFTLVEIVVAVVILGLVAVAILPVLIIGLKVTADQSGVATANRQLSSLIDQVRGSSAPTCGTLNDLVSLTPSFQDGRGRSYSVSGTVADSSSPTNSSADTANFVACKAGSTARMVLTVKSSSGATVTTANALIFIPAT